MGVMGVMGVNKINTKIKYIVRKYSVIINREYTGSSILHPLLLVNISFVCVVVAVYTVYFIVSAFEKLQNGCVRGYARACSKCLLTNNHYIYL